MVAVASAVELGVVTAAALRVKAAVGEAKVVEASTSLRFQQGFGF